MLAHLLVAKYCDYLPLYRQCEICAREGLEPNRSALCDWVGQAAWLLDPIVAGIRAHVFAAEKIHGDNTTVPVLSPGLGRTKTRRLWAYVRDDRPFCGDAPPLDAFFAWAEATLANISAKSKLAEAVRYAINRREALSRFVTDGRLEIDNNIVETQCARWPRAERIFSSRAPTQAAKGLRPSTPLCALRSSTA
jgi:hypothetical protein